MLFVVTAVAEIVGCYLPYLVLRKGSAPWLLLPAAVSLAAFAWLLTLHPSLPTGRAYAAYGKPMRRAEALFNLAQALSESRAERSRAREMAERSATMYRELGEPAQAKLDLVGRWLDEHRV
jgi:hypothetical protein